MGPIGESLRYTIALTTDGMLPLVSVQASVVLLVGALGGLMRNQTPARKVGDITGT